MHPQKANNIINALRSNNAMSEHDLENLAFLLTSSQEVIRDWYFQMDADDIEYAKTILNIAQDYFNDDAVKIDTTQSKQVLKKIMSL
jgi:hypothetical protein